MDKLGTITKSNVKDIWSDEPAFSSWLASEGLMALSETLGLSLSNTETEVQVGKYSADIVCDVQADGAYPVSMVIENQFGESDHKHLGQVLTYAAGVGKSHRVFKQVVRHVVWIAEAFNDEHLIAVDWLNENTGAEVGVFALAMECKSIGNSKPALELRILSKPEGSGTPLDPEGRIHQRFWSLVNDHLEKVSKPKPSTYKALFFGALRRNFKLRGLFNKTRLQVALNIDGPNSHDYAKLLEAESDEIEASISPEALWTFRENGRANLILVERAGSVHEAEADDRAFNELASWMASQLEIFRSAFADRVKNLQLPDSEPDSDGS